MSQLEHPVARTLRDHTRALLRQLLNGMFDSTDDTLFELADRSSSEQDHQLYFDSMRQIRLERNAIERNFTDDVLSGFDSLFAPAPQSKRSPLASVDLSSITLLQGDELEVNVAISGIVSKVTSVFSIPIMELTKRLGALCPEANVTERTNPLGPQRLCEAFAASIEAIEIDIKIRLILLKLFERLVMQNMLPVYEDANELLVKAGVLPDLKRRRETPASSPGLQRNPTNSGPFGDQSYIGGGQSVVGQGGAQPGDSRASGIEPALHGNFSGSVDESIGFGLIQGLLSGIQGVGNQPSEGNQPVIQTSQLMSLLNAAQVQASQQDLRSALNVAPSQTDLRSVIALQAPGVGFQEGVLRRTDEDVVNFIGMLFDYILSDRNLAIPMKALIARLQIPIVKLAILDKTFFEKTGHPARQLLNELSSLGIGWSTASELKRDHVYDMVESVVSRVLNDFNENPELFDELLAEIVAFRDRDLQRQSMLESRVRQAEAGRAKTQAAKQTVQDLINERAHGRPLPADTAEFVADVWSRTLVYAYIKHGQETPEWRDLVQTLDDLLWTMQPQQYAVEIERRKALMNDLLRRIESGLELIQLVPSEAQQWIAILTRHLYDLDRKDRAGLSKEQAPSRADNVQEFKVALTESAADAAETPEAPPEASFIKVIEDLKEGVWIELDQPGSEALRCKLTTIIEPGSRYVFVNRRGMKVLDRNRIELARDLQSTRLRILNDTQVFDRALQTVIGNLRKMQARPMA